MGFFDLNIPYTESTKRNSTADKSNRLKLVVKAMELGYTGVAYNRTITGVMSELDRCSIPLFPLSSVLKLSPSISTAVNLHRRLLDVPAAAPFRQYTRLTVVVDSPAQGSCLNSGNPVLKTYDIVAVRPLKQESFDQACKHYEVDIIAIDFSENRFRLKQPLIKAAIERGVCFEITYSGLVMDSQLRRQIISNAKLLVDWTRGKNIIFTSAAASVTEFRGPNDVANLACLLGFSNERAKASVSKTCRSLLENSLRKKKFFKEAIKVELISSTEDGFDDWLKWDPISSGEGDLQLDDMAKSFAASNKETKTVKAIDFVSVINELSSHGLQIKDMVTETKLDSKLHDENLETLASVEACAMIIEEPEQLSLPSKVHEDIREENVDEKESENICIPVSNPEILITVDDNPSSMFPPMTPSNEADRMLLISDACSPKEVLEEHTIDTKDVAVTPVSSCLAFNGVSLNEDVLEEPMSVMEDNVSTAPSSALTALRSHDEPQVKGCDSAVHEPMEDWSMEVSVEVKDGSHMNHLSAQESSSDRMLAVSDAGCIPKEVLEEHTIDTKDVAFTPVSPCLAFNGASLNDDVLEERTGVMKDNVSTAPSSVLTALRSHDESQINGSDSVVHEPMEDVSMEVNVEVKDGGHRNHLSAHESSSERVGRKHKRRRSVSFSFKRFLKPSHFKNALKFKRKRTIL